MLSVLMAIVTVLLFLGFISNLILIGVFTWIGNNVGFIVCIFVLVLYLGFVLGFAYFYNLNKCEKYEDEKKYFEEEISRLHNDIEWYGSQLQSYKKLDKYKKEHYEYEVKQSELEEENKKLKNIIRSQSNVKSEDFERYLKVLMEDKNAQNN